jgi:hypothetical protein
VSVKEGNNRRHTPTPNRANVIQNSKIISRPSDGVTRKRRGVWNGNWHYWTLTILNYTLLWRNRQFKQCTVQDEKHWVFPCLSFHQSSGTGFKRRTLLSWIPKLSPHHSHSNSYARMQTNEHCLIL